MKNMDTAKPDSRKTEPMPNQCTELDFAETFTPDEFEKKISHGLIPKEMEDKWHIYLDGNTLYLHRSWSGHCIYKIEFTRDSEKYSAVKTIVNRDPEQYRETNDSYDSKMLHFLISNLLLGKKEPFPVPSDMPKEKVKGVYQHHMTGTGYSESKVGNKSWWKFWK